MATFYIKNFGCRATQADATAIEWQLLEAGQRRAAACEQADLLVIHTCTVTASADAQARQAIRSLHQKNPRARILVTGCYAQRAPEELAAIEGVSWVVGNSHQKDIGLLLGTATGEARTDIVPLMQLNSASSPAGRLGEVLASNISEWTEVRLAPAEAAGDRTRPVLKIQDGCNHRCAYCVLPFVRGRSRSLPPEQVLGEIRRLVACGYKEVVLSGINLGSYGRDLVPRVELVALIRRVLEETPLERLRISSLEPMDVTQELVELVGSTGRLARHFHVPLQSGSNRVLARMHRWYRAAHYARRLELIRERLPGAGIGGDVIVGFPGETPADHQATLRLIEHLPFTYLHVFPFSPRPGTAAATMPDQVPPAVIKQRSKELRALAAAKAATFRQAQVGRTLRVLTLKGIHEDDSGTRTEAISDNYLRVRLAGAWPAQQFVDARITADAGTHLLARQSLSALPDKS